MTATKNRTRLSLDVSDSLNETLERLAKEIAGTKSDVLRKAITLIDIVAKAQASGEKVTLVDPATNSTKEIVGILPIKSTTDS